MDNFLKVKLNDFPKLSKDAQQNCIQKLSLDRKVPIHCNKNQDEIVWEKFRRCAAAFFQDF